MNGLLEKLRRCAIRALGGYVELVPPMLPQDRMLIKSESRRIEKITTESPSATKGSMETTPDNGRCGTQKRILLNS